MGGDAQQRVAPLPGGQLVAVILDLVEQHRHEIDRAADPGWRSRWQAMSE
jgi:hypothetical protein